MNFKESRAIYLQIADRICDDIFNQHIKIVRKSGDT